MDKKITSLSQNDLNMIISGLFYSLKSGGLDEEELKKLLGLYYGLSEFYNKTFNK